jgi:hypothetical protein
MAAFWNILRPCSTSANGREFALRAAAESCRSNFGPARQRQLCGPMGELALPATSRHRFTLKPTAATTGFKMEPTVLGIAHSAPQSRKPTFRECHRRWTEGTARASAPYGDEQALPTLRCRSLRAEADQIGPDRYLACSIVAARPLLLGATQDSIMSSTLVDGTARKQPRLRTEGKRRMSRAERLGRPALSHTR